MAQIEELRSLVVTIAALANAVAETSARLPKSRAVEAVQCLANLAEREAEDALRRAEEMVATAFAV